MAFIDNMRDKLNQAGQFTVQKAKNLSEMARLNSAISTAEKEINELYGKIGYEIYRAYSDAPQPEVADLIQQVIGLHDLIESSREQIKSINGADNCPQCGAKISKGMVFCSGCGNKLVAEETPAAEETPFCSKCGAQLSAGAMFCTSCGQRIG